MLELNTEKHPSSRCLLRAEDKYVFLWIQYVCIQRTPILASGFTLFIVLRDDVVQKAFCVTEYVSQLLAQWG